RRTAAEIVECVEGLVVKYVIDHVRRLLWGWGTHHPLRETRHIIQCAAKTDEKRSLDERIVDGIDLLKRKRSKQQVARKKKVVPISPSTRADRLVRFITCFDRKIRNKSAFLPILQACAD